MPARRGRVEAWVLIAAAVLLTVVFACTPLDITAARLFYRPQSPDHWPLALQAPWSVLYAAAPWITASLVLAGLGGLAIGIVRRRERWRRQATFVLLSVIVGPGLLVNLLFKDHWDRPRPRDLVQFAGPLHYVDAPLRGPQGTSFPCGHCSVGFLYALGWWLWRQRHPRWAIGSLGFGLLAGSALGVGRMAAGGHFLSDIGWSALIAYAVAHVLYYHVLQVPRHGWRWAWQSAAPVAAALGGVAVLLTLAAAPNGTLLNQNIELARLPQPPEVFEVFARAADVRLELVAAAASGVTIHGELHGFGLPTSRLQATTRFQTMPLPTLIYRIQQRGWFTDLSGTLLIRLPVGRLQRIVVRVGRGNIRVIDATGAGTLRRPGLHLQLQTGAGVIQRPALVGQQPSAARGEKTWVTTGERVWAGWQDLMSGQCRCHKSAT